MTDGELKAKLLAEIERLITDLGEQRDVLLEELKDFIDSLPEEPVSEDLEDEYNNYIDIHDGEWTKDDYLAFARHFAYWQKEQMVKQSVDGKVIAKFPLASDPFYNDVEIYLNFTIGLSEGDKVKVIIIKDE